MSSSPYTTSSRHSSLSAHTAMHRKICALAKYTTAMSTLDFSRFVGPLGNSVDDGISHAEEDADAAEDSVDHDDNPALDSASFLAPSDNHPDEIS